jgi:hypothetical protein
VTKNKSHIIAQDVWDRDVFIMEECPFEEDVDRFLWIDFYSSWRRLLSGEKQITYHCSRCLG